MGKTGQIIRRKQVNIDDNRLGILLLQCVEKMFDKPCLSDSSGRSKGNVPPVTERLKQIRRFLFPVTKEGRRFITGNQEGVLDARFHVVAFLSLRNFRNANIAICFRISKSDNKKGSGIRNSII